MAKTEMFRKFFFICRCVESLTECRSCTDEFWIFKRALSKIDS